MDVSPPGRTPSRLPTHAALFVVQAAFALQAVEGKLAMGPRALGGEAISPWAIAMTRMASAALFFQLVTRALGVLPKVTPRDHRKLAGFALLGIVLNQALFLLGLTLTSPLTATLLGVTIPVLTVGMAALAGKERLTARTLLGIAIALSGVVSLTGLRSMDRGAVLVLLNCLCYAAYLVFSRETVRRLGALTVITWVFTWGALVFAPVGVPALAASLPAWTPRGFALVGVIVLFPTIVAYSANAWALGRSSATLVAVYIYVQPVLTALIAWGQLGVLPSPGALGAAALIALGVGVVASRRGPLPGATGGPSGAFRPRGVEKLS